MHEYDGVENVYIEKDQMFSDMVKERKFKTIEEVYSMYDLIQTISWKDEELKE
jgi:hypothetical protein